MRKLTEEWVCPTISQAPVVQKVNSGIRRIKQYPSDSAFSPDSDLSGA